MAFVFKGKDVTQKVTVKFTPAYLPEAKKNYYLRPANQQVLDIKDLAAKADIHKIKTDPETIVEGFNAGMELIFYSVVSGFVVKTGLGTFRFKVPGEYDGSETHLPAGVYPEAVLQPSAEFRNYVKEKVNLVLDGKLESDGFIAAVLDEATGLSDESATIGDILTINGYGLKVEADESRKEQAGVFFVPEDGGEPVKVKSIAVNEPRTLKVVVPRALEAGRTYKLEIVTQGSARTNHILKELRGMRSEYALTVLAGE